MVQRDISGRYRGRRPGFEVQLRVDVDGPRPCNRVSADYYTVSGGAAQYIGSMRVEAPVVTVAGRQVVIAGSAEFSMPTKSNRVQVTIARGASGAPVATLRHLAPPGGRASAYKCEFESPTFRVVELEEAHEQAVKPPSPYDTASLPSPGAPRSLTIIDAFADAGIEMLPTGPAAVIDTSTAGANATWSDAELHAAMVEQFSRWSDSPRWAIWLLHAASHDDPSVAGLMFDQRGAQRQGCAVFYGDATDVSAAIIRDRLHTCVHELGHGFNLLHSWQKSLTKPPIPSRPAACSWMNYPERFPGGADAYWRTFGFHFDDAELVHLRHAFEQEVIMGGKPFSGGTRRDRADRWDAEEQDRGLRLTLRAPSKLSQGVPVTVGLELAAITREGRPAPRALGPRAGTVDIAISGPRGDEFIFEPMLHHCGKETLVPLRVGDPPVRDYAFIHYGRDGFPFQDVGRYRVRARYTAPDGSLAFSDELPIHVRAPASRAEREVVKLTYGNAEVGKLLCLVGSDAPELRDGNETLKSIIDRYPRHPMAHIARVLRGTNLARPFKSIEPDGTVTVRKPSVAAAAALLGGVVDVPRPGDGRITTRTGVTGAVDAFINSRQNEVGNALPAVSRQRATEERARTQSVRRLRRDTTAPEGTGG